MKIYTKQGDTGETSLLGGHRVKKDDLRIEAYGTLDELNAALGVARACHLPCDVDRLLLQVQSNLFIIGAQLAAPAASTGPAGNLSPTAEYDLEAAIDRWDELLPPLQHFILPGGTAAAAALHLARVICRRAERRVVSLARSATILPETISYLNRLSDALFVAARWVNAHHQVPDVIWERPVSPGH